jgi:hypothetical protein
MGTDGTFTGFSRVEACRVIGTRDGEETILLDVLKETVGNGIGTLLSCFPGKLAYFEGELRERFLLVRK